jgi:hypothetical protein
MARMAGSISSRPAPKPPPPIGLPMPATIFGIFWPLCFGRLRAVIGEWDNAASLLRTFTAVHEAEQQMATAGSIAAK